MRSGRGNLVQPVYCFGCKPQGGGIDVFAQMVDRGGAGNDQDIGRALRLSAKP
jgi:hypothetical protein